MHCRCEPQSHAEASFALRCSLTYLLRSTRHRGRNAYRPLRRPTFEILNVSHFGNPVVSTHLLEKFCTDRSKKIYNKRYSDSLPRNSQSTTERTNQTEVGVRHELRRPGKLRKRPKLILAMKPFNTHWQTLAEIYTNHCVIQLSNSFPEV